MSEKKGFIAPVWENVAAPCGGTGGCPAHTNIAASLHALALNDPYRAWTIMMESHPLRAVLGRVCYGFCESPCNRGQFDQPISIQALEAIIGDEGYKKSWKPVRAKSNGKKVLIAGSGPCGLAAGWFLSLAGFTVEIREAEKKAGGMLRYGIPSYRLEKSVLDREIDLVKKSGVKIVVNRKLEKKEIEKLLEDKKFHAVLVATGAGESRKGAFPGENKAVKALDFLKEVNSSERRNKSLKGKKIVVVGGGNAAMDACRSAVRLGAESVTTIYRRTEDMMPAHDFEVLHAREEGVVFEFLTAPEKYDGKTLTAHKMVLGLMDDSGRQSPEPSGETAKYEADMVILAIGQEPRQWKFGKKKNIYLGGDADPNAEGTVIHAIAYGKRVASQISEDLTGQKLFAEPGEEASWDKMNVERYFTPRMRMRLPAAPPKKRRENFDPVQKIPSLEEGVVEAERCFRCGLCVGGIDSTCDWCFRACGEDKGMVKLMLEWNPEGPFYERTNDGCDSCGKCWEDCPRYVVKPAVIGEEAE